MNFGHRKPKKEVHQGRPPEMVLITEDEASLSPNASQKKMQGTPDTTQLTDEMFGGENWEFQMDPFDRWSHEKENHHAPRRVDPEMPKRSFFDKALCRKPKMKEGFHSKDHPSMPTSNVSDRFLCKKSQSSRSKSVPRSHRKPETLFMGPEKGSSSKKTSTKYNQQVDEFIEVSATPKQLSRISDLSDIEQREKVQIRAQEKKKSAIPRAPIAGNITYSQPLLTPALDDGNSVVVDGNASVQHETISVPPKDTSGVVQQKSDDILSAIRCAPLCNAGEMIFMAVDPGDSPKGLTNEKATSPPKPLSKAPDFERIHRSLPVSNAVYLEQSLANSFQGRSGEADINKKRVQSYSPSKHNRYSREAFEEEIRIYQKSLRESRNRSKMEDIQESDEYGESTSAGGLKSRRALDHSNKQSESYPHRQSRSVGRSEASSSSSQSPEFIPGRSARKGPKGRSKSAHQSFPSERNDKAKHLEMEAPTSDLPRKRSDFMISGMEMVTGDIERHRSKEHHHRSHQARPKSESRLTKMKQEWMLTQAELKDQRGATNNMFHSESGPLPIGDVISVPSSSNKLPIKTLEIPVMVESFEGSEKEDLRILEDGTDLGSAAFDEFDSESIYEDLRKAENRRRSLRSTMSHDVSGKFSRHSRKSGTTRHTDVTYGSASVEYDGCF